MHPIGTVDLERGSLVLRRTIPVPPSVVWDRLTVSDQLAAWYGTWTGDPAEGHVLVTMNAEDGEVPATRYDIVGCEASRHLAVKAVDGFAAWHLEVDLAEAAGGTEVVLTHRDIDLGMVGDVGPGWDWYLDRLVASIEGGELPGLAEFETVYLPLGPGYVAQVPPSAG